MATGKGGAAVRRLRAAFDVGAARELTDGQLLERFATGRGEGAELAFAALVERHGPMVLRVARGVLDDPHDAQDAFQATFLVLVAKARGLWVRDSLGPWLYQAARRTASCMKANAARRRRLDRRAARTEEGEVRPEGADDLARVLHEEIGRLPERYRAPVVLCDLEGRTHEQAARALGWPVGTVKSRQARARERLRERLARRGIAPGLGLLAARTDLAPSLPMTLVDGTAAAAVRFVASRAIAPGTAAALAREVIRTMTILRCVKAASVLLALGAASGAGLIAQDRDRPGDDPKPAEAPRAAPAADPSVVEVRPDRLDLTLSERGAVEASNRRGVTCEVEGTTTIIQIKPDGSRVKKGEVVAELDTATLRDALLTQRISTDRAEVSFKQATMVREAAGLAVREYAEGIASRELEDLQAKVAIAQAGIEKGRARLERTRLARKRLDEAKGRRVGPETPADVAADLAVADRLDEAELGLRALEFDFEAAKGRRALTEKYTIAKTNKRLQAEADGAGLDESARKNAWELEKSKAGKLERQIKNCTLRSPGDGIVIHANDPGRFGGQNQLQIEEGATVRERQIIFWVADPSEPMRINAKVPEAWVDQVRPGQAVRIKIDAMRNEVLAGVVRSVAPMADPIARFGDGKKVYTTLIQIVEAVPNLRPGLTATVEIQVFGRDDVLAVPVASVFQLDSKGDGVAVRTPEGAIELREVTLGATNGQAVEVKRGLRPGDRVFLEPMARVRESMRETPPVRPTRSPAPP